MKFLVMLSVRQSFFFVILCFAAISTANPLKRDVGDLLYTKCTNITQALVGTHAACFSLTQGENCKGVTHLTVDDREVFNKEIDISFDSPEVCGDYRMQVQGNDVACHICVKLQDQGPQVCPEIRPTCTVGGISFPLGEYDEGCFDDSVLQPLEDCRNAECPSDCGTHGSCHSGKCVCDEGWFGSDCTFPHQLFEQCLDQPMIGRICARLIFDHCQIEVRAVLQTGPIEIPLYNRSFPVGTLKAVFREETCFNVNPCNACIKWSNLVLNETNASGCSSIELKCFGQSVAEQSLGCFNDDQVVPDCFGTCPNGCSGYGTCEKGFCQCVDGFSGDDCSKEQPKCPSNCGGVFRGSCVNGVCQCTHGYSGSDCSVYRNNSPSSSPSGAQGNNGSYLIVFLGISIAIVLVLIMGVIAFIIKKKNARESPQFELLEADDMSFETEEE